MNPAPSALRKHRRKIIIKSALHLFHLSAVAVFIIQSSSLFCDVKSSRKILEINKMKDERAAKSFSTTIFFSSAISLIIFRESCFLIQRNFSFGKTASCPTARHAHNFAAGKQFLLVIMFAAVSANQDSPQRMR